jgi:putative membrane protein
MFVKHVTAVRAFAAAAAVVAAGAATAAVRAQAPPAPGGPPPMAPAVAMREAASDADFVRAIAVADAVELDAAKYVINRTADPAVRAFAQRMIDDHSTAAVELQANTRGIGLLPGPPDTAAGTPHEAALMLLMNENGTQLDHDYMRMQVPAHRMVLHVAEWERDNGRAPALRQYAGDLVPVVRQHLQIAETYLADHRLTPYAPPGAGPIPGHVAPNGPQPGPGTVNNPAAPGTNGGSTQGQNNGGGGTRPNSGPGYQPMGSGTPPPAAPSAVPSPHR